MYKRLGFWFLIVGAISMIAMSLHYLTNEVSGILEMKKIKEYAWFRISFKMHILFGLLAISAGAIQIWLDFRLKQRGLRHKRLGYVYMVSVGLSSIAGIVVAPFAMGGLWPKVGFFILGILWFSSAFMGLSSISKGQIVNHRKWMLLNYGLTFAAITQRTFLLVPLLTSVPFMPVYRISAWLPWMINTAIVYFMFIKPLETRRQEIL